MSALDLHRRHLLHLAGGLGAACWGGPGALAAPGTPGTAAPKAPPNAPPAPTPVAAAPVTTGQWVHALCAYGTPKYGPDFQHFGYVDPQAPKGGTLRLSNADRRSSFDKLNPFSVKGVAQAALEMLVFERLCDFAMDEPKTMYGLLAEAIWVAPDLSLVRFRLRPEARFANGQPLTAADVVDSFVRQKGKLVMPRFASPLQGVAQALAEDERTVRFDLRERSLDTLFSLGHLHVFSRHWGAGKPLAELVNEVPIATGPYVIDVAEMPSRLEFRRNPDYWAKDLPARRGMFNFDRIAYRLIKDDDVRREAFKAGEFDLLRELTGRHFMRTHQGAKWRDGRIIRRSWPTATGQMLQSLQFNLRRPQLQDIRVREALMRCWDFETINRYGLFKRANSLFANTDFAAEGPPSAAELALLDPFRAELPPTVFGPAFVAPRTDTHPNALRENLKTAARLLAEAGWRVGDDGVARNAAGQALTLELLDPSRIGRMPEFSRNLKLLGVQYTERLVDFALFKRRLDTKDFDTCLIVEGKFTLPNAADLTQIYHSREADPDGSSNYRGVKSRAVDALIGQIAAARTLDELRTAARALDRVVMWNHWQIPQLYSGRENSSYWNKFGIPARTPLYYQLDSIPDKHSMPWPLWTWWSLAADKRPGAPAPKA